MENEVLERKLTDLLEGTIMVLLAACTIDRSGDVLPDEDGEQEARALSMMNVAALAKEKAGEISGRIIPSLMEVIQVEAEILAREVAELEYSKTSPN